MTLNLNIAQVAYFVDDIENQARKMAATFGAGPLLYCSRHQTGMG